MTGTIRLGDVVSIERGTTYKSALTGLEGPILLGLGSIQRNGGFRDDSLRTYRGDSPERLLVKPGQLYASLKDVTQSADLLGAVARLPLDAPVGRLTQDTVRLDIKDPVVEPDYLYWVLRTPQYRQYCRAHLTGTTNLGLPREDFFAFEFPAPSAQLLTITEALGALDDKIESNERVARLVAETAEALYLQRSRQVQRRSPSRTPGNGSRAEHRARRTRAIGAVTFPGYLRQASRRSTWIQVSGASPPKARQPRQTWCPRDRFCSWFGV